MAPKSKIGIQNSKMKPFLAKPRQTTVILAYPRLQLPAIRRIRPGLSGLVRLRPG